MSGHQGCAVNTGLGGNGDSGVAISDPRCTEVAKAVCQWLETSGCQTLFITPGSPWENGYIESFNDKLRNECLNREVFRNGREAQAVVENWRQEYNNYRPHSSLDYLTPTEFARRYYEKNRVREVKQPVEKVGSLSL